MTALFHSGPGNKASPTLTCVPVELGLDMSPSKGSSGHLLTSMSNSDFSFTKGKSEGDEGRGGPKEEGAQP